jgi:hypothetical protein
MQLIIETSRMETVTGDRHPEGLINPSLKEDWETSLAVILHSPHSTRRVNPMPLHIAFYAGAPVEVVTALLEAYPVAATT